MSALIVPDPDPAARSTFYVTFGRRGLREGWVEVRTALSAREVLVFCREEYGPVWSGLYTAQGWEADGGSAHYYPAGCIGEVLL